jgi:DNA-binding IclR family transcriptional regulator
MPPTYPPVQGQYLAYIHHYQRQHGRAPSETDLQRYFQVRPSTVHRMVMKLVQHGWISREPGVHRSLCVLVPDEAVPALQPRSIADAPTHTRQERAAR